MPLLVASVVAVVPLVPLAVSLLPEVVADAEEVPVVSSGLFPQATMPMHMEIASIKANIRIVFFIFLTSEIFSCLCGSQFLFGELDAEIRE